ncbi:uncharacterized protein LOC120255272 [Dioscorea cayenensis subsp. rotundata]|uniref:Uncharacterized protein LOC120255272 n=1 Tax=Dioscorea cayennensis subsp. rotundata TaxID=55577 RepID=A0AB40AVL8_DIOCR|nr:uncharacterized protein LOC120255272 [Dioscorea cayenensis subsp. rotundata]
MTNEDRIGSLHEEAQEWKQYGPEHQLLHQDTSRRRMQLPKQVCDDNSHAQIQNMRPDRQWMYQRRTRGLIDPNFIDGVNSFVEFAKAHSNCLDGYLMRCPCNHKKCRNRNLLDEDTIKAHIAKYGFVENYETWIHHGESDDGIIFRGHVVGEVFEQFVEDENLSAFGTMIHDVVGPSFQSNDIEDNPTPAIQHIYDLLRAEQQELWPNNPNRISKLSVVARLMNLKAEHHFSERLYDDFCQLMKECVPSNNVMVDGFYETKQLVRGLGLPVEQIDCCKRACMLYWGEDRELISCKLCGHDRYKRGRTNFGSRKTMVPYKKMFYFPLTPRLQRLYASNATAKHMRCHCEHEMEKDGVMRHCSDSPAWKHFDKMHPSFASECRNVRLGLCTDGFQPFRQSGQQYSSWPVIVTPYNLPPWMCMKDEYMFLSIIVPGQANTKDKLDEIGVETYDVASKQNFRMRAALMWTISDFPAYSMLSGWSTTGKLACPYCMEDSYAFILTKDGRNKKWFLKGKLVKKATPQVKSGDQILEEIESFGLQKITEINGEEINYDIKKHCNKCGWKKRSIFWDLPYWKTILIRYNLDVMHIEKNCFDNIFNTVMNVSGKLKDNAKSREDLKVFCDRPELHMDERTKRFPKACYILDRKQKEELCNWLKELKFPDGYVSNMGRCVDQRRLKLFGMKSYDCHVFMQRLIPIAFRELLPQNVLEGLTELSIFFKDLTARVIKDKYMQRLEWEIPIILCKLERIFPPSFFDCMEHLPVHLAYEARIAGPV